MVSSKKLQRRNRIRTKIRGKVKGTAERPRLTVFRSNSDIYAQLIDDVSGKTMAAATSKEKTFTRTGNKVDQSKAVGMALATKAIAAGISAVVFDRSGYLYHGRIKSLADGAREGGLKF
jgi:large subunit ribosomal protein L18